MIRHPRHGRRGFTLLELSIVLAIIALIAGVGIKMAAGSLAAADRISTQERLNTIKLALDSFARTYGYLPCPANRTFTPTNVSFGVEARDTTVHTNCLASAPGVVLNSLVWFGTLPVRTLGLPDSYAGDSWGDKFDYAVSQSMIANPSNMTNNAPGINVRYGTLVGGSFYLQTSALKSASNGTASNNAGSLNVFLPSALGSLALNYLVSSSYNGSYTPSAMMYSGGNTTLNFSVLPYSNPDTGMRTYWQNPGAGATYVVVSHGKDGRGAYPFNGSAIPGNKLCNTSATANSSPPPCTSSATLTCIDIENCNDDPTFYDSAFNDGMIAAQHFDDYLVWGSNDLQRAPLNPKLYTACPTGTGTCENWCAACTVNYPGGGATVPPTSLTNPFLYKKVITSNSTKCTATCFWGGTTAGATYTKGP